MTMEQISILGKIYNTMLMIETHGESTIYMGECLMAAKQLLEEIQMSSIRTQNLNQIAENQVPKQAPEKGE